MVDKKKKMIKLIGLIFLILILLISMRYVFPLNVRCKITGGTPPESQKISELCVNTCYIGKENFPTMQGMWGCSETCDCGRDKCWNGFMCFPLSIWYLDYTLVFGIFCIVLIPIFLFAYIFIYRKRKRKNPF